MKTNNNLSSIYVYYNQHPKITFRVNRNKFLHLSDT